MPYAEVSMGIKIIKNEKLWLEDNAVRQLQYFCEFDGVINAVGLPDLHYGKTPVGAVFETKGIIYPFFIGNDIGCGMTLFDTGVKLKKFNIQNFTKKLEGTHIRGKYSIGGGNHFAEFQKIEKIYNADLTEEIGINKKNLQLLIHSGSRNIGDEIYRKFATSEGLKEDTELFTRYIKEHNKAVEFAKENRIHIADIIFELLKIKSNNQIVSDNSHNILIKNKGSFYHHKGSISALTDDYAVIAGSRGEYSYVVKCIPTEKTLFSISHGAGRKWERGLCKGRLERKYKKDELKTTQLGSKVITDKKELLYEEASEAYKNIEDVMSVLVEYGCIEKIACLRPLVTYKC